MRVEVEELQVLKVLAAPVAVWWALMVALTQKTDLVAHNQLQEAADSHLVNPERARYLGVLVAMEEVLVEVAVEAIMVGGQVVAQPPLVQVAVDLHTLVHSSLEAPSISGVYMLAMAW